MIVAAEKGIEFERRFVDIRSNANFEPEYIRLNPHGVVPTLVIDGEVVTNGPMIAKRLDEISPPLLCRPEAQGWIDRMEEFPLMLLSYSVWVKGERGESSADILADKVARAKKYAEKYPDLAEHYLRKQQFFAKFSTAVYDPEHVRSETERLGTVLEEMGQVVDTHGFLVKSGYSFADAIATSVLCRLRDLEVLDFWVDADHGLARYFERLTARPSFAAVFEDDPLLSRL
jgi:glutathione S-transferase